MLSKLFYRLIPVILIILGSYSIYIVVKAPVKQTPEFNASELADTGDAEKERALPEIRVNRPEISHLVDGKVTWKVKAEQIHSDTGTGDATLKASSGTFYRNVKDRKSILEFAAPMTIYNSKSKTIKAVNGVTGSLVPEKMKLNADSMSWDEASQTLVAEKISLDNGRAAIKGGRMTLKKEDRHVRLSGGVVAEFKPGGGK